MRKLTALFCLYIFLGGCAASKKNAVNQYYDSYSIEQITKKLALSPNTLKTQMRCIYKDSENNNTLYGDFFLSREKIELSLYSALNYMRIKAVADTTNFSLLINNKDESQAFGDYEADTSLKFINFIMTGSVKTDILEIAEETDATILLNLFEKKVKILFDKKIGAAVNAEYANISVEYKEHKRFGEYIIPMKIFIYFNHSESPFTLDISYAKNRMSIE